MEILPVTADDLLNLSDLQPEGWGDIVSAHQLYVDNDFCHPFKFMVENKILGTGTAIFNNGTAWLAHIIVHREHRNKGVGFCISDHLVKFSENLGYTTISLIATDLGKYVYRKLGFETEELYHAYKGPAFESFNNFNIRPLLKSKHLQEVLKLDREITGEDRKSMLEISLKNAAVYLIDKKVAGYYLPGLGEGAVYASTSEAGLELIKARCIKDANSIVLPESNTTAIKFLQEHGYLQTSSCTRMVKGTRLTWQPEHVFSRVGGFFG